MPEKFIPAPTFQPHPECTARWACNHMQACANRSCTPPAPEEARCEWDNWKPSKDLA